MYVSAKNIINKIISIFRNSAKAKIALALLFGILFFASKNINITTDTHYEYAALCGFVGSLFFGVYNFYSTAGFAKNLYFCFYLSLALLIASILQNLICSSCALEFEGTMWFVVVVFPTLIISCVVSEAIKLITKKILLQLILYLFFWLLSLIRGAAEAYTNPHIYLYAWQVGYFPGLAWDADTPITNLIIFYRLWHITISICLFEVVSLFYKHKALVFQNEENSSYYAGYSVLQNNYKTLKLWGISIYAALGVIIIFNKTNLDSLLPKNSDNYFLSTDILLVRKCLKDSIKTRFADIYLDKSKADSLQLFKLEHLTDFYILEIAKYFHLEKNNLRRPQIFIYENQEEQKKYTGAGAANFTKPWLNQVNITYSSIGSVLKHELVHILIADYGRFFGVALKQGITEGSATAAQDDFAERTYSQHLSNLCRIHSDTVLNHIYGIGGFANARESLCYFLSGAFTQFLIERYGAEKYLQLFQNEDFIKTYNINFEELVTEFKNNYTANLDSNYAGSEELITKYLFSGSSFYKQKCVRKTGSLNALGLVELRNENYAKAIKYFNLSMQFGITNTARTGLIRGLWGKANYRELLDSVKIFSKDTNSYYMISTLMEQADSYWNLGDTTNAIKLCDSIKSLSLSNNQVFRAVLRKYFIKNNFSSLLIRYTTKPNSFANKLLLLKNILAECKTKNDTLLIELLRLNLLKDKAPMRVTSEFEKLKKRYFLQNLFSQSDKMLHDTLTNFDKKKQFMSNQDLRFLLFSMYVNLLDCYLMNDFLRNQLFVESYESIVKDINRIKDLTTPKTSKYRALQGKEFINFVNYLSSVR